MDPELIAKAHAAIAAGANPQAVAARFRELTGGDLPSPAVAAGQIAPPGAEPPAPPPQDPTYKPAFARDAIQVTPEQAKSIAPTMAGAAMMAIPGGGFLGRQAVNAGSGAVMGAMEAEPGHRVGGALTGGLLGLGAGLVGEGGMGLLNAGIRRGAGRGSRVAKGLLESTGLPGDFEKLAEETAAAKKAASDVHYGPIDARGKLDNAAITKVLTESGVPAAEKPRSLKELQKLASSLDRTNPAAAGELRAAMEEQIPGLAEANKAYGPAVRPAEALDAGRSGYKTAADIRAAMKGMGPEESRNFAAARLHDIMAGLEKRDETSVAMLKQFLDAGPETREQLKTLFRGNDQAFNAFLGLLKKERSAQKVGEALTRYAPYGIGGLLGIGAYEGTRGLLR